MNLTAMTPADTSEQTAVPARPRAVQMISTTSETAEMEKFYLAVRAIESETRPAAGTRLLRAHLALNSGPNDPATSVDREKRPCVRSNSAGICPRMATPRPTA